MGTPVRPFPVVLPDAQAGDEGFVMLKYPKYPLPDPLNPGCVKITYGPITATAGGVQAPVVACVVGTFELVIPVIVSNVLAIRL